MKHQNKGHDKNDVVTQRPNRNRMNSHGPDFQLPKHFENPLRIRIFAFQGSEASSNQALRIQIENYERMELKNNDETQFQTHNVEEEWEK